MSEIKNWHGTTIILVRKGNDVVVAGDGQVSLGNTVIKSTAKKVRKIEKRKYQGKQKKQQLMLKLILMEKGNIK